MEMVIFDCDGVIVDSEIIANKSSAQVKTELGFPISTEEHIKTFCGQGADSPVVQEAWNKLPDTYKDLSRKTRIALMEKELEAIPNIAATLKELPLPYCMASNSQVEKIDFMLKLTALYPLFDGRIFSSEMVPRSKPFPDVYLLAAETMGVAPEKCLVVEDSVPGVTAGVAAGMTVLGFTGGTHHPHMDINDHLLELGACELFDDMTRLPQIIDRFLKKTA